jgi:ABC-type thiamin/hydroxymethylpyrimidine transport system permease subunit
MFRFAQAWLYRLSERPELFTTEQLRALVSVVQRGSGEGVETAWILQGLGATLGYVILLRTRYLPRALTLAGAIGSLILVAVSVVMIVEPRYINTLKLFGLPILLVDVIVSVLFIRGLPLRADSRLRSR